MNLSLSVDLFPKAKLPESVASPREHLSEILFIIIRVIVSSPAIPALDFLREHTHFFSLVYGYRGRR